MFKFLGDNQFLEVCEASKESMLLHDNGFIMLRLAYGFKDCNISIILLDLVSFLNILTCSFM